MSPNPSASWIWTACAALAIALSAIGGARADGCPASRDYLLGGLAGELPQTPQSYKALFDICTATAGLFNVKDAYILKDGGVGVVAKQDGLAVTAATLSEFCTRFPNATLRFITRKELAKAPSAAQIAQLSSTSSTPCRRIRGMPDN